MIASSSGRADPHRHRRKQLQLLRVPDRSRPLRGRPGRRPVRLGRGYGRVRGIARLLRPAAEPAPSAREDPPPRPVLEPADAAALHVALLPEAASAGAFLLNSPCATQRLCEYLVARATKILLIISPALSSDLSSAQPPAPLPVRELAVFTLALRPSQCRRQLHVAVADVAVPIIFFRSPSRLRPRLRPARLRPHLRPDLHHRARRFRRCVASAREHPDHLRLRRICPHSLSRNLRLLPRSSPRSPLRRRGPSPARCSSLAPRTSPSRASRTPAPSTAPPPRLTLTSSRRGPGVPTGARTGGCPTGTWPTRSPATSSAARVSPKCGARSSRALASRTCARGTSRQRRCGEPRASASSPHRAPTAFAPSTPHSTTTPAPRRARRPRRRRRPHRRLPRRQRGSRPLRRLRRRRPSSTAPPAGAGGFFSRRGFLRLRRLHHLRSFRLRSSNSCSPRRCRRPPWACRPASFSLRCVGVNLKPLQFRPADVAC